MVNVLTYLKNIFSKKKTELTLYEELSNFQPKDLDFYLPKFNQDYHSFIEQDIMYTIKKYHYINTFPIELADIQVGAIGAQSYKTMYFYKWFTDNGAILNNKEEILKQWLEECKGLVKLYEFRIKLVDVPNRSYYNAKKIAPYYYEVVRLVEKIKSIE